MRSIAALLLLSVLSTAAQTEICGQAAESFREHRWAEAADQFQKCETESPGKTDALLYRGKSLVNTATFDEAATSLESYVSAHPQSDDALYLLGYVRFRQDKPRESLELFARAAKLKEPHAGDLKIAALDHVLLNDYSSAAMYLEKSLQMNPQDLEARYHLGRVRYQQNRFDAAITAFQEVLRSNPNDVKAQNNLGLCLEAKGQIEAAQNSYRKAIELDSLAPAHTEQPYLNLGKLLTVLNREGEALPLFQQAATIGPNSAAVRYELGRVRFSQGKSDEARAELERAVRLDPDNSSYHYLLGRIYKRLGETQQAAAQFKVTEELMRRQNAKSGGMGSPQ